MRSFFFGAETVKPIVLEKPTNRQRFIEEKGKERNIFTINLWRDG